MLKLLKNKNSLKISLGLFLVFMMTGFNFELVSAYSLNITTSGSQSIDVFPASDGGTGTSISADNITVTTDCKSGYNFNLSASSGVVDSNLYLNGDSTSSNYFFSTDGSTSLVETPNIWGYYYNANPAIVPTKNSIFEGVPLSTMPTTIKSTLVTPSNTDISDSFSIYYGVSVSNDMPPGSYKMPGTNTGIVYAVTMAENCLPYTVNFNPTSTADGSTRSGTGIMNDQSIPRGEATALNANAFTPPAGYEFDSWNTEQDGTGVTYEDGAMVTDIAMGAGTKTLYAQWGKLLYDAVAEQGTKGTQTAASLKNTITTSNSGLYTYNASEFGAATDASNDYTIYYYRGILDSNLDGTTSTYGSMGNGANWPNYVRLDDTCWRIVRTTGSGGVKMIYNGSWSGGTVANSCANATTDAQITASAFNSEAKSIVSVGYTYDSSYLTTTSSTWNGTIFSNNDEDNSIVKDYIENTWFDGAIGGYEKLLEEDAGYCNDRDVYTSATSTTPMAQDANISTPYYPSGSSATYYRFGARQRNQESNSLKPSLACSRVSGNYYDDVYTTSSAAMASTRKTRLKKPVALLTADEASFAGSGYYGYLGTTNNNTSAYHANSYLRSGSDFWLLSPAARGSDGVASMYQIRGDSGALVNTNLSSSFGVRPVITLKHFVMVEDGTGTATDPWTIGDADKYCNPLGTTISEIICMQDINPNNKTSVMNSMYTNTTYYDVYKYTLIDSRDNKLYNVAKLADGNIWMTQNLDHDIVTTTDFYTPTNTDIKSDWTADTATDTTNNKINTNTNLYSYDFGDVCWKGSTYSPNTGQVYTTNGAFNDRTVSCNQEANYLHLGNRYNWTAAIATNDSSNYVDYDEEVDQSICPAGWTLPRGVGNTSGSFMYLVSQLNLTAGTSGNIHKNPAHFVYGGDDDFSNTVGRIMRYWSSTVDDSTHAKDLYIDAANSAITFDSNLRQNTYSVRCVAR